ncbi:hypothetical protein EJ06DRAFT_539412 [Trichodelitschia bisporula]|uniref:PH domain-containing protein n=1 Tax=Trichodelitschia bisporula TaxID=703511 RepID=A0A6G1HNP9_9PEZI|nr:hypothetical protein EJ06DRAFT_539412 [Trichodelitschia bisporula]
MVGMEQLEVHSKSYLVRWVHVSAGHTISWSLQPHKKSLNFGLFKHPGGSSLATPNLPPSDASTPDTFDPPSSAGNDGSHSKRRASRNDNTTVVQKLEAVGLRTVAWTGKCEADKVTIGSHDVLEGEGGMYALVFDNTFSKQVSKTVTFVLMTYPTDSPPRSGHLHFSQASAATTVAGSSPALAATESSDSLPQDGPKLTLADPRPRSGHAVESRSVGGSTFYTGVLQKKRRKGHNSFARRYFSLDFTTSTLSYYRNRHSSALRGAIPLSLAAISTSESGRIITIDSGAEIWHLKAGNQRDFIAWRDALERASQVASSLSPSPVASRTNLAPARQADVISDRHWQRAEELVSRVSGIRDSVRRLAQDTDPKYTAPGTPGLPISSPGPEATSFDYFGEEGKSSEKLPFWKRKSSSTNASPAAAFRRTVSSQLAVPGAYPPTPSSVQPSPRTASQPSRGGHEEGMHQRCMAILKDLDQAVAQFSTLLSESKQRRISTMSPLGRRPSIGSVSSDEFFDAHDATEGDAGHQSRSQLLTIRCDSEEPDDDDRSVTSDSSSESSSAPDAAFQRPSGANPLLPTKPKSLTPLPLSPIKRRTTIPPAKVSPPSLISFLRKNVGKDLSTIAMPVSANEPTSLLQRVAEQLEYSELLDAAAANGDPAQRLLYIAAFAVASFSSNRVKERAARKPFNPMLGETYELVREDKGFRFVAEKVSHRPVQMACQADAQAWSFLQAPLPVQKFWGKSAEINTEGRARVVLHARGGEAYSWTLATSFLRNVIAGEKYVEPVSTMTIRCHADGGTAVASFKAGGMFAGRSEEVGVQCFDERGELRPQGLAGKWTSELRETGGEQRVIWKAGQLVDGAAQRYGFTVFAAGLNEVTDVEEGHLPPTDSRLRPDLRSVEEGHMARAEEEKARLEEAQRVRRREMEERGEGWTPKWFVKVGEEEGEEVWGLKGGREAYWECRARGEWNGVVDVFGIEG